MARPRVPSVYAVLQLFLRLASIALCISAFTAAVAATAKFDLGRAMSGAFVASILAIPIDVSEVIGLADAKRHARRCTEGALCGADFVTAVICGTVPVLVYLSVDGVYHECPGRPSEECDREERRRTDASQYVFAAWVLPLVVGILHLIFCMFSCIDCCRRRRRRARESDRDRDDIPIPQLPSES